MSRLIVVLILVIAMLSGCKMPKIITEVKTEWRDTTIYVKIPVYVDKIIEVPLPVHDTLKIIEKVYVDKEGLASMKTVHKEKGIIGADITVYKGILTAELYLTDSTIHYRYKDTLTFEDSVKIYNAIKITSTSNTVIVPPQRYIPKFYKFTLWFFVFTIIIAAGFIVWKVKGGVYLQKLTDFKNKFRGS